MKTLDGASGSVPESPKHIGSLSEPPKNEAFYKT